MTKAIAALLIAVFALVSPGGSGAAKAEPRGWRGRRSRGRGYYRPRPPENPIPGILGGILGGWLAEQMRPKEEEDDQRRDREGN